MHASESLIENDESLYKLLFDKNPLPMWIFETGTYRFLEVNEAAIKQYGYTRNEFLSMTLKDIRPQEEIPRLVSAETLKTFFSKDAFWRHIKKNGEIIYVEIIVQSLTFKQKRAKLVSAYDVTKKLFAEDKLVKSNERFTYANKATFDVLWDADLSKKQIYWSDNYELVFGYKVNNNREALNEWLTHIHPDDKLRVETSFFSAIKNKAKNWSQEYRFINADKTFSYVINRGVIICDAKDEPCRMVGVMQDYTDKEKDQQALKRINASLQKRAAELASSNAELEQFTYVASHDLQEPLRMVSSFLQLLQKKYNDKLDDKAREYITFAVDGAERMKLLILDLLKYSRVNMQDEEHETVNVNDILRDVVLTYMQVVQHTNAAIHAGDLPIITGSKTQIFQLFQNLIGNALKYRSNEPPHIEIIAEEQEEFWQFTVKDNGIGIDKRFFDKIFVLFKRLHQKHEYSGTGIGLAICKKIVEKHGGKIWVESAPGSGSKFMFTIKKTEQA